jgi:hypothetical protein
MSKLRFQITMTLDGCVAGPHQSVKSPLGEGANHLICHRPMPWTGSSRADTDAIPMDRVRRDDLFQQSQQRLRIPQLSSSGHWSIRTTKGRSCRQPCSRRGSGLRRPTSGHPWRVR